MQKNIPYYMVRNKILQLVFMLIVAFSMRPKRKMTYKYILNLL